MAVKKKKKKKVVRKKTVKRKPAKKAIKRKPAKKTVKKAKRVKKVAKKAAKKEEKDVIGKVTHYFPHVRAGVIKLKVPLKIGDTIKIKGHTTDFTQVVASMQIDRVPITEGKKGDEIGLLVDSRVRRHDTVYKA